jgi:hypothetical protein
MKNPVISSGIEPATFLPVRLCLGCLDTCRAHTFAASGKRMTVKLTVRLCLVKVKVKLSP